MRQFLALLAALLLAAPAAAQMVSAQVVGGATLLQSVVTSGSQANVTFSSIPQNYSHLQIKVYGASAGAVGADALWMQFNGDTAANYDYQQVIYNFQTSASGGGVAQANGLLAGYLVGTSGPANPAAQEVINVLGYTGAFRKTAQATGGNQSGTTTGSMAAFTAFSDWHSTAAVTSIKLYLNTGPFANGTVVSLYGLP